MESGVIAAMVGGAGVTEKATAGETPPPGAGFVTVMLACAAVAVQMIGLPCASARFPTP